MILLDVMDFDELLQLDRLYTTPLMTWDDNYVTIDIIGIPPVNLGVTLNN